MIKLGTRLSEIAEHIPHGSKLIDVGCDHGRLPVSLLLSKRIVDALAVDINSSPLDNARFLAKRSNLSAKCFRTLLSDGLSKVDTISDKTIVIAGMGGMRICKILRESPFRLLDAAQFILQPNSDVMLVRQSLVEFGLSIIDESMCLERGKRYTIIVAKSLDSQSALTDQELYLGPVLMKKASPLFLEQCDDAYDFLSELQKKLGDRFPAKRCLELQWLSAYRSLNL